MTNAGEKRKRPISASSGMPSRPTIFFNSKENIDACLPFDISSFDGQENTGAIRELFDAFREAYQVEAGE